MHIDYQQSPDATCSETVILFTLNIRHNARLDLLQFPRQFLPYPTLCLYAFLTCNERRDPVNRFSAFPNDKI